MLRSQVLHAVITYLDPNAPAPAWVAWVPEDMQGYYIVAVLFFSGLLQVRCRLPNPFALLFAAMVRLIRCLRWSTTFMIAAVRFPFSGFAVG